MVLTAKHKHNGGTRLEEIIGGIQCETSDKQDATEARENDDSNHLLVMMINNTSLAFNVSICR